MLEFFFFSKMGAPFCSLFNISDMHAGAVATSLYQYGEGSIHFSHFGCSGNEVNITSCRHFSPPTYCNGHYRDASIVCRGNKANTMCANIDLLIFFSAPCTDGDVQLAGDTRYDSFGRVEVCVDGVWGKVCNEQWTNEDASVLCRQLGFSPYGISNFPLSEI
jgi:hypothetical protein